MEQDSEMMPSFLTAARACIQSQEFRLNLSTVAAMRSKNTLALEFLY